MLSTDDEMVKQAIEGTTAEAATRIQGIIDIVKVDVARFQSLCDGFGATFGGAVPNDAVLRPAPARQR